MLLLYGVLCVILTSASATLRLFHGAVTTSPTGVPYNEVHGVVALNLRPQTNDFMDCISSTTHPDNLRWEKDGKIENSIVENSNARRLDLASAESAEDLGIFVCFDTETHERLPINITAGAAALCPVKPRETVGVGSDVDLRVYADADPALESGEIQWTDPNNNIISNDSRFSLLDIGRHLRIQNASLEDDGTYRIVILQETTLGNLEPQATATIELEVMFVQEVNIAEDTIYAISGSTIQITVTINIFDQTNFSVNWYYNGSLIDTSNNPQYSISTDTYSLTIANVKLDVLGMYEVLVTSEGNTDLTDTVSVMLLDPPTAAASPEIQTVPENVSVTFYCTVSGTNPTIVWSFEGDLPLPSGVMQNGSDLVISQTHRDQSGVYECSASNRAAIATSVVNLTVHYPPTATIQAPQVLPVTITQGDSAPTFSCISDGVPTPALTWRGPHNGNLPAGLSLDLEHYPNEERLNLVWNRPSEYTDSGQYLCIAMNSNGSSTATLDLLVRYLPVITSIFPKAPVTSASSFAFGVPMGYTGPAITCTAIGWPTPTVQWLASSGSLTNRTISKFTSAQNFVSATLVWETGFVESDAGGYMCTLQDNDTTLVDSRNIVLQASLTPTPITNCSLNVRTTYFRIRVLDTDCVSWNTGSKQLIISQFQDTVQSVVSAECNFCLNELSGLTINTLQCSRQVSGAAVFRGRISTEETREAEDMFCVLYNWQQNGAYVLVNNSYHLVDSSCSVRLESLAEPECSAANSSPNNNIVIIGAVAAIGAVLLFTTIIIILVCVYMCRMRKKRGSVEVYLSNEPRTVTDYDRAYPTTNDQADVSPSPLIACHTHHYSGLSHHSNTSSPSSVHGRHSQEFELRAHNSKSLLLDDTEGQSSRQSVDGNLPNIYRMDLLDMQEDSSGSQRQSHDLDDDAIEVSDINSPQYEVIARKHPLRTSSSSSRVPGKDRLLRASLASAFSTGHIGSSFKNQDHDSRKDYSHLDRGDSPRASCRSIKGLRVSSLVMSNTPSLPSSPALHRGKQPTPHGYSTYSPKLQDSPLLTDSCSPVFSSTLPHKAYSTLVTASSTTADYEEIITPIHKASSQDVLVSHDYSEPRELEKRHPSFPIVESNLLMEGYGEPSALGIPTLGRNKSGDTGKKSMIPPYSQVSNTDIDSYAYNHPTALDRPEIPSYGTVPEQKPRLVIKGHDTHHKPHVSNSELSLDTDFGRRNQHRMSNRQLPKIPSSENIQPANQKPGNTIPPYSQVSKPQKKNVPHGTKDSQVDDESRNSLKGRQSAHVEITDSDTQELPGNNSSANTPRSPRKIPPYSQVSNSNIDIRQKKASTSSFLEPVPYSEPVRSGRKSEPTLPAVFKLLNIPRKGSEPTTYTNPLPSSGDSQRNPLSPRLQRAPSPYSEPVKSHQLQSTNEFTFTLQEKLGVSNSYLFNDNEPSPYSEPVTSTAANKTGDSTPTSTIPLAYTEPVTRTNGQRMERNSRGSTDSQIATEMSTFGSTVALPYSEPVVRQRMERNSRGSNDSQIAAEKMSDFTPVSTISQRMDRGSRGSNDSQIASPYCEPTKSRNTRK